MSFQKSKTQCQVFQNNIALFEDKFETIPTFDFLDNPNAKKDTIYFYQINIYISQRFIQ